MWTLSQTDALNRLKTKAQECQREDAKCHAYTGVLLNERAFSIRTHITRTGVPGGEHHSLMLTPEYDAAKRCDIYALTHEAADDPLEFASFGDAVEVVEMRIAETAERIGV